MNKLNYFLTCWECSNVVTRIPYKIRSKHLDFHTFVRGRRTINMPIEGCTLRGGGGGRGRGQGGAYIKNKFKILI